MAQLCCSFVKEAKKMCNNINSEVVFDNEFAVDGILIFEGKVKND